MTRTTNAAGKSSESTEPQEATEAASEAEPEGASETASETEPELESASEAGGPAEDDQRHEGEPRHRMAWLAWALVLAAALFLGWACWSFWDMRQGDTQDLARDRDRAMIAAKQQLAALNTMDAKRIDQGLQNWLDASTGPLHDELKRTRPQSRQPLNSGWTSPPRGGSGRPPARWPQVRGHCHGAAARCE